MNCLLCNTELTHPNSIKYRLCLECRLFPGAGNTPQTDEQHNRAVALVRRKLRSTIVRNEDNQ